MLLIRLSVGPAVSSNLDVERDLEWRIVEGPEFGSGSFRVILEAVEWRFWLGIPRLILFLRQNLWRPTELGFRTVGPVSQSEFERKS